MKKKTGLNNIAKWYDSKQGFKRDWIDFHKELMQYRFRTMKPFFKGHAVLELGIADGEITQYLFSDFKKVVGVEGAAHFIEDVKKRFSDKFRDGKLELHHCLFEEFTPSERYPTVLCTHILEHMDDPVGVLIRAREWLENEGVLIAMVPNAMSLHRLAGVKMGLLKAPMDLNPQDKVLGHQRVYSPETFKADVEKSGLHIKTFGGLFLKPLTNKQIQETWSREMMDAFYELGKEYPEIAAEIYAVCVK